MEDEYKILESEGRNKYVSVVWSHKIQEKQADIYSKRYEYLETAKIISASLTSVGIISLLFTEQLWVKILSALISFVSVFVSAYFKSFNLSNLIKLHKDTANQLLRVRDQLELVLLDVKLKSKTVDEITDEYKEIVDRLHTVYDEAPSTTDKAVEQASKALNINKDNTFTDSEIDKYLPEALRKGRK